MPASWISAGAAVIGVANSMGAFGGGGGGGGGGTSTQYDPYGPYRGAAATQLQDLMKNPCTSYGSTWLSTTVATRSASY